MAKVSNMLVFVLGLGAMFAILIASTLFAAPSHAHFDKIPTEPRITQLQALEIVEKDLKTELPETQEIKLMFQLYNFSSQRYESDSEYVEYIRKIGYWYAFEHIRDNPEPLQMPLRFVHANGTVYNVDASTNSFEKICDEPSLICPMGRFAEFAMDRLVYQAEIKWEPATEETHYYNEGYYFIDAESGQIVWNSIEYEKNRKPMPNVNFDNKTIAQLFEERLHPPESMHAGILRGASLESRDISYLPEEIRVTLGVDNRVIWTNRDLVAHTVVSDAGHSNGYTGRFESELIEPGETFEYIFFETGEYPYHCDIHPWMTGRIEVLENFS